jgi:hypothetical protein
MWFRGTTADQKHGSNFTRMHPSTEERGDLGLTFAEELAPSGHCRRKEVVGGKRLEPPEKIEEVDQLTARGRIGACKAEMR